MQKLPEGQKASGIFMRRVLVGCANHRSGSRQGFRNTRISMAINNPLGAFRYKVTGIGRKTLKSPKAAAE